MKPTFIWHHLTEKVYKRLEKLEKGEIVGWDEVTQIIGMDAQVEGSRYHYNARRMLRRDKKIVIEAIIGVGLKRLTDVELSGRGRFSIRKIHRTAKRECEKINCMDNSAPLTEDQRRQHQAHQLMLGYLISETTYHNVESNEKKMDRSGIPPQQDLGSWSGS